VDGVTHSDASPHFTFLEGKTFPPDFDLAMFLSGGDVTQTGCFNGEVDERWHLVPVSVISRSWACPLGCGWKDFTPKGQPA
jgi:hypothetical protein